MQRFILTVLKSPATLRQTLSRYFPNKRSRLRHAYIHLKHRLTYPFRRTDRTWVPAPPSENEAGSGSETGLILHLDRIARQRMETEPYQWAFIDRLYRSEAAASLVATFPRDRFTEVTGHDGEKGYSYMSRSLVHIGATSPSDPQGLSAAWQELARDLISPAYRAALSRVTGVDLSAAAMEVNVVHYGPGAWLGPHVDSKEKLVTHVLYFNETWDARQGGCIQILRSSVPSDVYAEIPPIVGNSVLLVRSPESWHAVARVAPECRTSRRSVLVTFYPPGTSSSLWRPGANLVLQDYPPGA